MNSNPFTRCVFVQHRPPSLLRPSGFIHLGIDPAARPRLASIDLAYAATERNVMENGTKTDPGAQLQTPML